MSVFTHPLARDAKVWVSGGHSGPAQNVLVIITRLELSRDHPRFKAKLVERLSAAAAAWIEEHAAEAAEFLLMNRPKRWIGDKD